MGFPTTPKLAHQHDLAFGRSKHEQNANIGFPLSNDNTVLQIFWINKFQRQNVLCICFVDKFEKFSKAMLISTVTVPYLESTVVK